MIEEEQNTLAPKPPVVIVNLDSIYDTINLKGEPIASEDIIDFIRGHSNKKHYILIDTKLDPLTAAEKLSQDNIPYNGIMRNTCTALAFEAEMLLERIKHHCGTSSVHSIIDFDIQRLKIAEQIQARGVQTMCGQIVEIHYKSTHNISKEYADVFPASVIAQGFLL